ncbi:MAG TPA: helix-turn-helix domain-containing protein [Aldersonia sp.]
MVDERDQRLRMAAARADFLEYGRVGAAGVPEVVAASWERSQAAGVDADSYRVEYHGDIDFDSRLARCARPVIERLMADMAEVPATIALTDAKARIVDRRDCSTAIGRLLDRVDFLPGYSFAEGGVGTNGVGTVFESGSAISVVGPAHFNEALVPFACTGAPVLDLLTGRVEGVLDVSLLADTWSPLLHALVKSAAVDIGRNLLLDRGHAQHALFDRYLKANARPRQAVIAVGDSIMINQRAQVLLSPDEQLAVQEHGRFLMTRGGRTTDTITLASGRVLHARADPIVCGGTVAGIVLLLNEIDTPRDAVADFEGTLAANRATSEIASGLRNSSAGVTESRSPAWNDAQTGIAEGLAQGDDLLVVGEAGCGKFTLLLETFHRLHPTGRSISVDADQFTNRSRLELAPNPSAPVLLVLRNIDRISADGADAVEEFFAARPAGCHVAATLSDTSPAIGSPLHTVLGRFDRSVTVPPLRFRTADLPHLVARALREIAPDRRTRVSPQALRILGAHTWPRNLTELREALESALRRRPVGEIQAEDLPGSCRTTSTRTLSAIEVAERDAIVTALQENGGNRLHAAQAVGMSRSSLYRKLKSYGISGM